MPLPNISHEHLVHFNCPLCQKWWSIGDEAKPGSDSGLPERDHWYCPWCGQKLEDDKSKQPLIGFWTPDKDLIQAAILDPETQKWKPVGEIFERKSDTFSVIWSQFDQSPKIIWE